MSDQQELTQSTSARALPLPKRKLSLLNSLIILAIIYLVCEILPLFATVVARSAIPWIELCQWILLITWLIVGVRPPFMEWLKRERARKE